MKIESLPFANFDETLQTNLRKNQLPALARWLIGTRPSGLLALECNSNWEAALTIEFLVNVKGIFQDNGEQEELCKEIVTRVPEAINHLLSEVLHINDKGHGHMQCWDGGTWDTAVVVRALLTSLKNFPEAFAVRKRLEIERTVKETIHWLAWRFDIWETEIKYPFGVSDVAQILNTLIFIRVERPDLFEKITSVGYLATRKGNPLELDILRYLLKEATPIKMASPSMDDVHTESESLCFWGSYFHTAEVLDVLSIAYAATQTSSMCPIPSLEGKLKDVIPPEDARTAKSLVIAAIRYLERNQVNGQWTTHVDTMRCLEAYVKATYLLKEQPEPHIVFRGLRWTCDKKQVFKDGSFLHTLFLTTFYSHALVEIYRHWELAQKPLLDIYDDVVWASPTRTTTERGKRLQAEIDRDDKVRENVRLEKAILRQNRILLSLIIVFGIILMARKWCCKENNWQIYAVSLLLI